MGIIWLSGSVRPELAGHPHSGFMLTPAMGNRPDLATTRWAADSGCFAAPDKFRLDAYLAWLAERRQYADTCLFATAPDRFGDGQATWEASQYVLPVIRALGYRPALVLQPGIERVRGLDWDNVGAAFLGGPNDWQNSAAAAGLVAEAKRRGLWTHRGRVNSRRRLAETLARGFDSADGTFLAFGPDKRLPEVRAWLETLGQQAVMELTEE